LLHRSSPPLALPTPCPCTHHTHGLSTTSPSFTSLPSSTQHTTSTGTVPPVTSPPQHTHHAACPSRTHATTVLATQHHHTVCPHRPPPQPTQPAPHGRSQHTSLFLTSVPSNDLLTDLHNNRLVQQGLLLTSAPVQLSAPHRQFVLQSLLLTSARTYTHRHSTTSTQHPRLQLNLLSQQHVTSTLTLHFQLVSSPPNTAKPLTKLN
jgi:hypothetical protein